jgi:hypothetical protein
MVLPRRATTLNGHVCIAITALWDEDMVVNDDNEDGAVVAVVLVTLACRLLCSGLVETLAVPRQL